MAQHTLGRQQPVHSNQIERNRTKPVGVSSANSSPKTCSKSSGDCVSVLMSHESCFLALFSRALSRHDLRNPRDARNLSSARSISQMPLDGTCKPSISTAANVLRNLC